MMEQFEARGKAGEGLKEYAGRRVIILGAARQGMATARFFLAAGARVTVSDMRPAEQLAAVAGELEAFAASVSAGPRLHFAFNGHPLNLLDEADLLCLSGGVSPAALIVRAAVAAGIPLSNDGMLTLRHCPAPIIGITGSAGKTTTTSLAGLMLEAAGYTVHVGGNIGTPLLDRIERIGPDDKVVMELSSFQLELFDRSPAIAGLLNITPNHLDRHPSMSHYAAAKANIVRFQGPGDLCVLNAEDDYTGAWLRTGHCQIEAGAGQAMTCFPLAGTQLSFSLTAEAAAGGFLRRETGPASENEVLVWRPPNGPGTIICRATEVRLRGRHNLANILAACCLAGAAGAPAQAMREAATTFAGVEHRLEIIREHAGITWVNDSIATAPERTVAALRAFAGPARGAPGIVLLAGGRDKHLPWDDCAAAIHEYAHHAILFGEAAELIQQALLSHAQAVGIAPVAMVRCNGLPQAVAAAAAAAQNGDVVLLAPGGASFDAYQDFAARGEHFRALVEALPC
jgi:UDP-N-acetylmuramoylalanine--D-glutamate ligase